MHFFPARKQEQYLLVHFDFLQVQVLLLLEETSLFVDVFSTFELKAFGSFDKIYSIASCLYYACSALL